MHNQGNYIVSLGDVVRWLGREAEALGVEIYPGFSAAELLEEDGRIVGIATGDMGIGKDGEPGPNHQPGMELRAPYTLFAEGCRGSLSKQLMARFNLRQGVDPQDLWARHQGALGDPGGEPQARPDRASFGWPMDSRTYGGSWLYHLGDNLVSYGFVIGLDYSNTWISPFDEMQRLKAHPHLRRHFEGGRRIGYGARALSEGGLQSIPRLTFPRRRAARRCGRVPQRAQDQGHPCGDEVRHDGGRGGGRGAGRPAPPSPAVSPRSCARAGCRPSFPPCATSGRPSRSSATGAASSTRPSTRCCCAERRPGLPPSACG